MDIGIPEEISPRPGSGNIQPRKLLLRALAGEQTERPPIWLMRQAGRYLPEYHQVREAAGGMVGLCTTPEHAVEVTLQPLRRFPLDAAIVFSDLPQVAAALGQTLDYRVGEGPVLTPPVRSTADITEFLSASRLHEELAPIYETVRQLSHALPTETALIGYAGAPWTIATYMVEGRGGAASEHSIVKQWAMSDPDGFQPLMDLLTNAIIQFLSRQIEAGAEAVQLFDSWAGVLPDILFDRWCVKPVATIISALKAQYPDVPVIAFPRGAGLSYDGFAQATGADCVGLDSTVPLEWAARKIQRELGRCVQGNLDPQLLIAGGPALHTQTERILRGLSGGPFIFNLGHGIAKTTPIDHVTAVVEQVHAWKTPTA
ncbi:uroporphyrinogen decarboxylase [Streptomyces asiaticus]